MRKDAPPVGPCTESVCHWLQAHATGRQADTTFQAVAGEDAASDAECPKRQPGRTLRANEGEATPAGRRGAGCSART